MSRPRAGASSVSDPSARPVLYTVGHSTHAAEGFVALLRRHQVSAVGDVRSQPYSRHNPQFNRETLARTLRDAGIAYVFLGDQLGARIDDPACLVDGRVSYERVAERDFFRAGLDRVRRGAAEHRLALMCAERDPITCHRMMLVTRNLRTEMEVRHIRADGSLESNPEAERRLLEAAGMPRETLFEDEEELVEGAYARAGARMSYTPERSSARDDDGS